MFKDFHLRRKTGELGHYLVYRLSWNSGEMPSHVDILFSGFSHDWSTESCNTMAGPRGRLDL
jgi:hypothetical protein